MKPLIGLTPTPELRKMDHGTFRLSTLSEYYSKAVEAAGGIPVILPTHLSDTQAVLDRLDGIIITGGGDIDPSRYDQIAHETTGGIDHERDQLEIAIVKAAIAREMPLLGICRGLQVLNVALAGSLHQDIDTLIPDAAEHRQQNQQIFHEEPTQTVTLAPGEHPLTEMANHNTMHVNTFHHQSINRLGEGLQAIAHGTDGVIESVYYPQAPFCMAVQWHPEMLASSRDEHAAIFRGLIEAALAYQSTREIVFA